MLQSQWRDPCREATHSVGSKPEPLSPKRFVILRFFLSLTPSPTKDIYICWSSCLNSSSKFLKLGFLFWPLGLHCFLRKLGNSLRWASQGLGLTYTNAIASSLMTIEATTLLAEMALTSVEQSPGPSGIHLQLLAVRAKWNCKSNATVYLWTTSAWNK